MSDQLLANFPTASSGQVKDLSEPIQHFISFYTCCIAFYPHV